MKKKVTDLKPGDIIDHPAGEKVWLWKDGVKRRYTVTAVTTGKLTKRGQYIKIEATCPSPYRENDEPFNIDCQMIETKIVTVR